MAAGIEHRNGQRHEVMIAATGDGGANNCVGRVCRKVFHG